MSVKIISDFKPTQMIYIVGDDNHAECMIDGKVGDNFKALSNLVARLIIKTGQQFIDDAHEEKIEKLRKEYEGKEISDYDIGTITVWRQFQDQITQELTKLKIKEDMNIPDVIKKIMPDEILDKIISDMLDEAMSDEEDGENE